MVCLGKESHELGLLVQDGFLLGFEFVEEGGVVQRDGGAVFSGILQCPFQAVGVLEE